MVTVARQKFLLTVVLLPSRAATVTVPVLGDVVTVTLLLVLAVAPRYRSRSG